MKRILSIICIIFLIGITSAVPYYSTSYFVYAEENNEQLSDDEILNAGLSLYLNSRNGFITIADGTLNGAKLLMKNTIDSFLTIYNENSPSVVLNKSVLISKIIVKYSPFRVSLQGSAVRFFNDLYDYLEEQGKVDNASNSSGGDTTDTLYDGYINGNSLYYHIYITGNADVDQGVCDNITVGSPWNGLDYDYLVNLFNSTNGSSIDYSSDQYTQNISQDHVTNIPGTSANNSPMSLTYSLALFANSGYADYRPLLGVRNGRTIPPGKIYGNKGGKFRGCLALIRVHPSTAADYSCFGVITYYSETGKYYFYRLYRYYSNQYGTTTAQFNFETTDFDKNSMSVPDEGKEVQITPRDKDTGDTYNTYNEYINNYVQKKTVTVKKIINEGDSGNDDQTDPTQSTQNPYPLDPTDPSSPTGGTIPDWTTPSGNGGSGTITPDGNGGYTFELPDFSLPDLNINWSISGLAEKFPFSIPFDLYALFTVLNAEPETPEIHGEVPIWTYTWEIDWDLHQFDSIAALMRNLEFIAFCIGLAIITRNLIRG